MYKIIIVDDEKGTLDRMARSIEKNMKDFKVEGLFTNGKDALDFLYYNNVDAVITDIKMPVMNGLELAKRIRIMGLKCRVIVLSGFGEFDYAQKAIEYGVWQYVVKPVNSAAVRKLLEKLKKELGDEDEVDYSQTEFLTSLFRGEIKDINDKIKMFNSSGFAFDYKDFCGVVAELKINNYNDFKNKYWDFEAHQMKNIIYNVADFRIKGVNIINQSSNTSLIVLITDEENICKEIETEMNKLLPLKINVTPVSCFSGFENIPIPEVMEKMNYDTGTSKDSVDVIELVKDFIKKNYNRNLSRSDIADHVYLNETYVGRIFKKSTGKTVREYHLECRMKRAAELLEADEKISSISRELGYNDKRVFLRQFKAYNGCSPIEYKKKIREVQNI